MCKRYINTHGDTHELRFHTLSHVDVSVYLVVDRLVHPHRCPQPNSRNLRLCHLPWQNGVCRRDNIKDPSKGRWPWTVLVGPAASQGPDTGEKQQEGQDVRTGPDVGGLKIACSRPRRCHKGPLPERGEACGLGGWDGGGPAGWAAGMAGGLRAGRGKAGSLLEPELRVRLLTSASTACSSAAAAGRDGATCARIFR